ncbi:transposase [Streptomyces sp. NPDC101776]|uniref:transposase n=1 Tax=Streptomyces sp. NPDC101776 TaxID=3366146 RepID=UPI0037F2BB37
MTGRNSFPSPSGPASTPEPARPGEPAREEFEYRRHGTASLIAALDVVTDEVLTEVIARNDAVTFTAFLDQLDAIIAPGQEIHMVLDSPHPSPSPSPRCCRPTSASARTP